MWQLKGQHSYSLSLVNSKKGFLSVTYIITEFIKRTERASNEFPQNPSINQFYLTQDPWKEPFDERRISNTEIAHLFAFIANISNSVTLDSWMSFSSHSVCHSIQFPFPLLTRRWCCNHLMITISTNHNPIMYNESRTGLRDEGPGKWNALRI